MTEQRDEACANVAANRRDLARPAVRPRVKNLRGNADVRQSVVQ